MDDPINIHNWRRLDERTTTSGQPTERQLAELKMLGVQTVINLALHTHDKALADEAGSVAHCGMNYIHIPVDFQCPTSADLVQFYNAMSTLTERTIHVHCIANYRVSAFFYRWRVDVLGWSKTQARADLNAVWTPNGVWDDFINGV